MSEKRKLCNREVLVSRFDYKYAKRPKVSGFENNVVSESGVGRNKSLTLTKALTNFGGDLSEKFEDCYLGFQS